MTEVVQRTAEGVAAQIDRRRFVRKLAHGAFYTLAVAAAGGGFGFFRTAAAYAYPTACLSPTGAGCPSGCGPSRCCNYLGGRPSGCNCGSGGNCTSGTTHCLGKDSTWSGEACWTCYGDWFSCAGGCSCRNVTTCCDCKTSGCNDSPARCISHTTSLQKVCPNRPIEVVEVITA